MSVEWSFLWEVLQGRGLPLLFLNWLQVLYRCPTASVRLEGGLSASFHLYRGTCQGCPLSPALFSIAIEPVGEALHTSPGIKGLRVSCLEERVAFYADNLLLFLNDPGQNLGVHQVLDSFFSYGAEGKLDQVPVISHWLQGLIFGPTRPTITMGGGVQVPGSAGPPVGLQTFSPLIFLLYSMTLECGWGLGNHCHCHCLET